MSDRQELHGDGGAALFDAVIDGDVALVKKIIGDGAKVSFPDEEGWTLLHFSARDFHVEIAQVLLDAGAEIDAQNVHGNTPLGEAVFGSKGRGEMIRLLLRRGANPNLENMYGVSPKKLADTIANYNVAQWFK